MMIRRPYVTQDNAPDGKQTFTKHCLIQPVPEDPTDQVTTESEMNVKTANIRSVLHTDANTSTQKDELQQSWISISLGEGDKSSSSSTGKPEEDYGNLLSTYTHTMGLNNGEEKQLSAKGQKKLV